MFGLDGVLGSISLIDRVALIAFMVVLVCSASLSVLAITRRRAPGRRLLPALVVLTVGLTGAFYVGYDVVVRPFNAGLAPSLYPATAVVVLAVLALLTASGRRLLEVVALALAVGGTVGLSNHAYAEYPTIRSLNPTPVTVAMTYDQFLTRPGAPTIDGREVGALVTVDLPGATSGFAARPALAYVPPVVAGVVLRRGGVRPVAGGHHARGR